ncbi:CRISPR-associated helicase/endonuclease Cas3 [Faecalimicrobium dakarense]|uniref:CRISPR-associated helicase/endonuclease Cas3 n=1 Tax=Faecalimicrobium dakarense TaxID=1301100 RepID=UPI0004AC8370|nr:CRISPR-associated helicase/endonuclease Cas3 [[Clostridium] dakarense]
MYFKNIRLFDIDKNVSENQYIYAHMRNDIEKETLKEHVDLVYKYFIKLCDTKDINSVFERFQDKILNNSSKECIEIFKELISNAIYMHDVGKINSDFQYIKMKNNKFKDTSQIYSKHSMLSSIMYFDYYFDKIRNSKIKGEDNMLLLLFLTVNSYVISKHHGILTSFNDYIEKLPSEFNSHISHKELYKNYKVDIKLNEKSVENLMDRLKKYIKEHHSKKDLDIEIYIYSRLMFSLLTSCDFYATSEYQNKSSVDDFGIIEDVSKYYDIYKSSKIYKGLEKHKQYLAGNGEKVFEDNDINRLRTEMNIEAESNLVKEKSKNIYYLEAPTGSGKTITSINLALKSLEINKSLNKIFYIFPFNTLIEQTYTTFVDDIFQNVVDIKSDISIINSITPITTVDIEEDNKIVSDDYSKQNIDYEKSLLNRQFLHYPIVLTTHIGFFNYLFGTSREESYPLIHLANSVVILDEIQSYKNSIWKEIILFLEKYAELLNIKIIIMSATLPRLDKLGYENGNCAYLIKDREKYFSSELFKDRVEVNFDMISNNNFTMETLLEKVLDVSKYTNKILIEFIKKTSAVEFYKLLKNEFEDAMLISGDDNKNERKKIISKVKNEKKAILVATQVVEAGVDIDMDIGFKDISILDSEEQFLGRINRSCKKSASKVFFFNIDDASGVYKHDFRKQNHLTLMNKDIQNVLLDKDFEVYYDKVIADIENSKCECNDNNISYFLKDKVGRLEFDFVKEKMRLIDKLRDYTVFLNTVVNLENGKILVGSEVWEEYKNIIRNNDMSYAKKRIELSNVMEKVDYFTYKLRKFTNSYSDSIGDIFYIADGEKYFADGKFARSKFGEDINHEFI